MILFGFLKKNFNFKELQSDTAKILKEEYEKGIKYGFSKGYKHGYHLGKQELNSSIIEINKAQLQMLKRICETATIVENENIITDYKEELGYAIKQSGIWFKVVSMEYSAFADDLLIRDIKRILNGEEIFSQEVIKCSQLKKFTQAG